MFLDLVSLWSSQGGAPALFLLKPYAPPREIADDVLPKYDQSLHLFRVGYQTVGQPWNAFKWQITPPDFPDIAFPSYDLNARTHIYRVGFQTVGQSWLPFQITRAAIADAEDIRPAQQFWNFNAVISVTAGQPWWLWQNIARVAEPDAVTSLPDQQTLHRFRTTFQTVGQPWALFYRLPLPRFEPDEIKAAPIPWVLNTTVIVAQQPWFMYYGKPSVRIEIEDFRQPVYVPWHYVPVSVAPVTTFHQVNIGVSFGIGLGRIGGR